MYVINNIIINILKLYYYCTLLFKILDKAIYVEKLKKILDKEEINNTIIDEKFYEWKIENWEKNDGIMYSSEFSANNHKWYKYIYHIL